MNLLTSIPLNCQREACCHDACKLKRALCLSLILGFFCQAIEAKYGGGTGELNDPYLIATAEHLILIGSDPNLLDKHFALVADIDLNPNLPGGKVFDKAVIAPEVTYEELMQRRVFNGSFNGNGYRIKNLTICSAAQGMLGLFGITGEEAHILNIGLENVSIKGKGLVGALSGLNHGSITHCYSTGSISCTSRGGGLGGLVGDNWGGSIIHCHADCDVSGEQAGCMGGLVGNNWFYGRISSCYASGAVNGEDMVGGLVGASTAGDIRDCYATSSVSGSLFLVGGLAGFCQRSTIRNCYVIGRISVSEETDEVGGLVGQDEESVITACFWNTETSGMQTSDGGTGLTASQMMDSQVYLAAGWDFVGESINGTDDIWAICEGQDYPKLTWQFVVGDFNGDMDTDFADFCMLAERWLGTDSSFWWCRGADLTDDGYVDFDDLKEFADNWLRGIP